MNDLKIDSINKQNSARMVRADQKADLLIMALGVSLFFSCLVLFLCSLFGTLFPIIQTKFFEYIFLVALAPLLSLGSILFISKQLKPDDFWGEKIADFLLVLFMSGLAFLVFKYLDLSFFYKWNPLQQHIYFSWLTAGLSISLCALIFAFYYLGKSRLIGKISNILAFSIIIGLGLYCASFGVVTEMHNYNANALNFSVVVSSIVQVAFGKTLLVDLKSQYGLYAHFLQPFFILVKPSLGAITSIFAGMLFISFLNVGFFLIKTVENKLLAVMGFIAFLYSQFFLATTWPFELYFQYYPLRTFFPTLMLPLAYTYFKKPTLKLFVSISAILSLGALWNIDTGLIAWMAFILASVFFELAANRRPRLASIRKSVLLIFTALLASVAIFIGFTLFLRLRSGFWPDWSLLFYSHHIFMANSGGVSHNGSWILLALTYLAGVVVSMRNLLEKIQTEKSVMIWLLTIFGIGIFSYYVSRQPHETISTLSAYPAVLLWAIFADDLWKKIHYNRPFTKARLILWVLWATIVSFPLCFFTVSFFQYAGLDPKVRTAVRATDWFKIDPDSKKTLWAFKDGQGGTAYVFLGEIAEGNPKNLRPPWLEKAAFVEKFKDPAGKIRDDVLIISEWDYLLYLKLKAKSPLSIIDWHHVFMANDWDEIFSYIKSRKARLIIFDDDPYLAHSQLPPFDKKHAELKLLLEEYYKEVGSQPVADTWYDGWKPNAIHAFEARP